MRPEIHDCAPIFEFATRSSDTILCMKRRNLIFGAVAGLSAAPPPQKTAAAVRDRVAETERGFAASMARRDFAAFTSYLSEEAVFLSGAGAETPAHRGKRAVAGAWKKYFQGPTPPFTWAPDVVEVLDSGRLALSSGPVQNPKGEQTGRFTSIWRLEDDGRWRIVFDRGCQVCRCS